MVQRIIFLGNNKLGLRVLKFLKKQKQQTVGLVVHPRGKSKLRNKLIQASGLIKPVIFSGDRVNDKQTVLQIKALKPDLLVSVLFGYILKSETLKAGKHGAINLHPAYLPYNRGAHPNVWSIIDETPAGVSLHRIDEDIDTGGIIAQKGVEIMPSDTGRSLYQRLEDEAYQLFADNWRKVAKKKILPKPQKGKGSFHKVSELSGIDEVKLNKKYKAKDLINLIRARTFAPYQGAFFRVGDKKIYMRMQLSED